MIINKHGHKTGSELSNLSHLDIPWIAADDNEILKYEAVFYRTEDTSVRQYPDDLQDDD